MIRVEGAKYRFLTQPVKFIAGADGKLAAVECIELKPGKPDSNGRRNLVPVEGSNFSVAADTAIVALGYYPDLIIGKDMFLREGVFIGGDFAIGSGFVITVTAGGKKAALAIDAYLKNKK